MILLERHRLAIPGLISSLFLIGVMVCPLLAVTTTWDGSDSTSWSTGANWDTGNEPTLNDDVVFPATIPATGDTIVLSAGEQASSLRFDNSYSLTGGTLTIGAVRTIYVASGRTAAIASDLDDDGAGHYLIVNGPGTLVLSGNNGAFSYWTDVYSGSTVRLTNGLAVPGSYFHVTGAAGVVEMTGGINVPSNKTIYLSGTATNDNPTFRSVSGTNTWSGTVTLHNGGGDHNVGVDAGSTLILAGTINQTTAGNLVKVGPGTLVVQGTGTYTGSTKIKAGTLQLAGGANRLPTGTALSIEAGATFDLNGQNQTVGGITCANGAIQLNGGAVLTINGAGDIWPASTLSGSGGLTKAGAGLLTIGAASSYSGPTNIDAGTLCLYSRDNVLPTTGDVNIAAGAKLSLAHSNSPTNTTQTINRLTGSGTVTIDYSGRSVSFVVGNGNGSSTFDGVIENGQGTVALTKTGSGTLTLTGASTYTGGTTVAGGTLQLAGGANRLNPSGNLTIEASATFDLNGQNQTLNAVTAKTGSTVNLGAGRLTVGSNNGTSDFWANTVVNGTTGGLTKVGTGDLYLAGTANYTGGTSIDGGMLALYGPSDRLPTTGNVAIASGARLDLTLYGINGTVQTINGLSGAGTVTMGSWASANPANVATLVVGNGNGSSTFDGVIQNGNGTVALTKTGSGTLTLTGANTYSGVTQINGGVLNIQNSGALGSSAAGTVIGGSTGLHLQNNVAVAAEPLTFNGGGAALRSISGSNSWGGPITFTSGNSIVVDAGSTLTISGNISGPNVWSGKSGDGTLILSGNNSGFAGWMDHSRGILRLQSNNAVPGTYIHLNANNAAVELEGGITIPSGKTLYLNGTGISGVGVLHNTSGNNVWNGAVILYTSGGNRPINVEPGTTLTLANGFSADTQSYTVIKTGGGTLILGGGSGSWTTQIQEGVLRIRANNGLGTFAAGKTVAVSYGAALEMENTITTPALPLTLSGSGIGSTGALRSNSGTNTYGGPITLATDSTMGVDAGTLNIPNAIGGGGGMGKVGPGRLVLSATNTYTGPTSINAGTLALSGSGSLATSPLITIASGTTFDVSAVSGGTYSLASGQTLKGDGRVLGNLNAAAGSTISAGGSPGHLTVEGNFTIGGTLLAELAGPVQGSPAGYDWIDVTGTATLDPGTLIDVNLVGGFTPGLGDSFDILTAGGGITNADLSGIAFDYSDAPLGSPWIASIVSLGGSAEALRLSVAIPEPASGLLAAMAMGILFGLRRFRRRRSV